VKTHVLILSSPDHADHLVDVIQRESRAIQIEVANTADDLERAAAAGDQSLLISFATSVIVPRRILERFGDYAINFHAASPEYPGRDPHHFAHYDQVKRYGATAHIMTPRVDNGPIVAVEYCDVPAGSRPVDLLTLANAAAYRLIDDVVPALLRGEPLKPLNVAWSDRKRSRADFLSLCRLPRYADEVEVLKRSASTEFEEFKNLFVDFHGFRFRLEGRVPQAEFARNEAKWRDFTEAAYAELLDLVRDRLKFAAFGEPPAPGQVLWCHHVQMSVHRARRLAEIERRKGLTSTFFLMVGSPFYDLREPSVLERAQSIVSLGHRIGLLFDVERHRQTDARRELLEAIIADKASLTRLLETDVDVLSCGVQPVLISDTKDDAMIAGMINASAAVFRKRYMNLSDDGGRWGGGSISDVLGGHLRQPLHVVVHPEWWTPDAMSPQERVERCVNGRATSAMRFYETKLARG
jgi:hypothetical protein